MKYLAALWNVIREQKLTTPVSVKLKQDKKTGNVACM